MRTKRLVAVMLALLLVGCSDEREWEITTVIEHRCDELAGATLMRAVTQCAAAANPRSDEEGEDLVRQCQETVVELMCPRQTVQYVGFSSEREWERVFETPAAFPPTTPTQGD